MSIAFDIRHLAGPSEIDLFNRLPYALNDEVADDLEQGRRRVEWTWVAVHGNRPMAKAFERAGYVTFQRLLNLAWPQSKTGLRNRRS